MTRLFLCCSIVFLLGFIQALPFTSDNEENEEEDPSDNITEALNATGQDLILIKTVVYEMGILTDDSNNTDGSNETQEVIDVAFFNPGSNGSFIDLTNIPAPFQTNVSGVTITGVAPANFGSIKLLEDGTPTLDTSIFPIIPNKQVKVTHNVSTVEKHKSALLLDGLSDILGLKGTNNDKTGSSSTSSTPSSTKLSASISVSTSSTTETNKETPSEIVA